MVDIQTIITSVVCCAIASIIGISFRFYLNKTIKRFDGYVNENRKTTKANNKGTCVLLKRELRQIYLKCQMEKCASIEDKEDATEIYEPYHEMGGNGGGTKYYEYIMKQPIK